jgi:hypothetical protein
VYDTGKRVEGNVEKSYISEGLDTRQNTNIPESISPTALL